LYQTGDRVRYRADGTLEFLGRVDHQVKLRGFRIELGEIETILSQYPGVKQVVVVLRGEERGHEQLVAYIVEAEGFFLADMQLRPFVKAKLPHYMVPSAFVVLDALPYTPNGKINYKALPPPAPSHKEDISPEAFSPTEELIAEVWKKLLGVDQVSVYDNFFDLGGYSLLSIQVISQLEPKLGFRLRPVDLMLQTLGQVAADCDSRRYSTPPNDNGNPSPSKQLPLYRKILQALKDRLLGPG
jgi:hypothetical protein